MFGIPFPKGQDSILFEGCQSLTCHEAGEETLNPNSRLSRLFEVGEQGELIAKLTDFLNYPLPNIDILVQIGFSTLLDGLSPIPQDTNIIYKTKSGDDLITYEGQRFLPNDTITGNCNDINKKNPSNLRDYEKVTQATVTEVILGFDNNTLPNQIVQKNSKYTHTKPFIGNDPIGNAEAYVKCTSAINCDHHGFQNTVDWLMRSKGTGQIITDVSIVNKDNNLNVNLSLTSINDAKLVKKILAEGKHEFKGLNPGRYTILVYTDTYPIDTEIIEISEGETETYSYKVDMHNYISINEFTDDLVKGDWTITNLSKGNNFAVSFQEKGIIKEIVSHDDAGFSDTDEWKIDDSSGTLQTIFYMFGQSIATITHTITGSEGDCYIVNSKMTNTGWNEKYKMCKNIL